MVDHLASVRDDLTSQVWRDIVALAQGLGDNLHAKVIHRLDTVVIGHLVLIRIDVERGHSALALTVLILHIKKVVALPSRAQHITTKFLTGSANVIRDRHSRYVLLISCIFCSLSLASLLVLTLIAANLR